MNIGLFSKGIDAWWMDATEPDLTPSPPTLEGQRTHVNPTAMGTGSRVMNGYALMNSRGVLSRTAQRRAQPARLHSHALGFCRNPALRHGHLVRRRFFDLDGIGQADSRRLGLLPLRRAVLDHRQRRLHHGIAVLGGQSEAGRRGGMARTGTRAGSSLPPSAR